MQAPLSSTASGKKFHLGPSPVHSPHLSVESGSALAERWHEEDVHSPELRTRHFLSEELGLAHDAGNLLGALGLYCDLLARPGVLREEHRHYARELQLISGRSRSLIDRLLSPATTGRRPAQGAFEPEERVVVPEVIEQCRGLLDTIARRAVRVAYEAGAGLPVAVPRESLERILVNLTKNAAEAGAARPGYAAITLRVSCQRSHAMADRIVLSVEDKGCGLSSAAVKVLLDPAIRRDGPHGLGFRVVRELAGQTGGLLRMQSCTDAGESGTTVEISWAVAGSLPSDLLPDETRDSSALPRARPVLTLPAHSQGDFVRGGEAATAHTLRQGEDTDQTATRGTQC